MQNDISTYPLVSDKFSCIVHNINKFNRLTDYVFGKGGLSLASESRISTTSVENKTYKVLPFYTLLFSSIVMIHQREIINDFVIRDYLNYNKLDKIPKLIRPELVEKMVNDLLDSELPIEPLSSRFSSERIAELKKMTHEVGLNLSNTYRIPFNVRLNTNMVDKIQELHRDHTEKLGEIIELSIANYVLEAEEDYFNNVLKFFFDQVVKAELKKLN